ncbi:MAG: hypothetical protein ACYC7L_08385 [Nitrospirota bacterium]
MKLLLTATTGTLAAAIAVMALALTAPASAAAGNGDSGLPALEQSSFTREEKQAVSGQVRAALVAGVPADDLEIIMTRGLARGVNAATLGHFLETSARVAQEGLPVRPVLDRIEQGLSKGVPPERIDAAGRGLADGLAKARPLVEGLLRNGLPAGSAGAHDAALEAVARAHEQSLPAGMLQALGKTVSEQGGSLDQFERAVRTLSFLAGSGMRAETAERIIRVCVERNCAERDYGRMERTVSDLVRQGRGMDDIVRAADREVREARGAGEGRDSGRQDRGTGGRDAGTRSMRGK